MIYHLIAAAAMAAMQPAPAEAPFEAVTVADLDHPWAMNFLPDGKMIVTEKEGRLLIISQDGETVKEISGVPDVDFGGQGGLGDVILHPDYQTNRMVYLSYAEAGKRRGRRGAAVGRGVLDLEAGVLRDFEVLWRQVPKVSGRGHYGHRMRFSPDGTYLYISSGERQKFDPAQSMKSNLGKIVRLYPDGSVPDDNPFHIQGGVAAQVWTLGNRNPLGIAFDREGTLWEVEMGPAGGDEFQRIERGVNYGYPEVSNGDHYSGRPIPDHDTRPEFRAPDEWWTPVISPSSLIIYGGGSFPGWQGDALIGGLSSKALIRVSLDCEGEADNVCEAARYDMGTRIRGVVEGPAGDVWLLEDGGSKGGEGRIMRLQPK